MSRFMLETNNLYLELFPDELDMIAGISGGVDLRINSVIVHCIITATEYWRKRRLTLQEMGSTDILASIFIFEGESYTIRTGYSESRPVLVSKNTLPATLSHKVGWAFGFTARNRMTMDNLQAKYRMIYNDCAADLSGKPIYKVFSPWLHAAYRRPDGTQNSPTVYWATQGDPNREEALSLMKKMSQYCATAHNRFRINYVIDRVQSAA